MGRAVHKKRMPADLLERAAAALRVLAHPQRLRIVEILLERPVPVGKLAEELQAAPAAVSQHLSQMRAHGIVAPRRRGNLVFYEVINPNAVNLIGCLQRNGDGR